MIQPAAKKVNSFTKVIYLVTLPDDGPTLRIATSCGVRLFDGCLVFPGRDDSVRQVFAAGAWVACELESVVEQSVQEAAARVEIDRAHQAQSARSE